MTAKTWPDKQTRDTFFDELRALIARYPNLSDHMARHYENCPEDHGWDEEDGYPAYDLKSPMFLQGVVVIVSHANMEHYEDLDVLTPYEQSGFMTTGMLSRAAVMGSTDDESV